MLRPCAVERGKNRKDTDKRTGFPDKNTVLATGRGMPQVILSGEQVILSLIGLQSRDSPV